MFFSIFISNLRKRKKKKKRKKKREKNQGSEKICNTKLFKLARMKASFKELQKACMRQNE